MAARAARKRPVEYSILYTATLCLLAFGAVMVYSASSAESLLSGTGDPSFYLKRYVIFGGARAWSCMHLASRHGLKLVKALTPVPADRLVRPDRRGDAAGRRRDGERRHALARRRPAAVPALGAAEARRWSSTRRSSLAARPTRAPRRSRGSFKPLLIVVGAACLLLLKQPDMGTAMVICFAIGALLIAAGVPLRQLGEDRRARWSRWR